MKYENFSLTNETRLEVSENLKKITENLFSLPLKTFLPFNCQFI